MSAGTFAEALSDRLEDLPGRELAPVEVAVLDSGVDATHPDLMDRIDTALRIDTEDGNPVVSEVERGTNNDVFGHGTGVASIIARIAPNARIVDIRVLGSDNKGSGVALVEGLRRAVDRRSRVVNMSLAAAAAFADKVFPLCEKAYYRNQVVVASRRNMPLWDNGYPAEFSSCISVDNRRFPSPYHFHYLADKVIEYAALGEEVPVAAAGGGYTTMTGTSFATPTIAGICALIVGAYPELRPFEVKALLKAWSAADP
jgi:subtilisin family serine protease